MHKSFVSFPKSQQEIHPGQHDEAVDYLDYLLDLADRLFRGQTERDEERTA